MPIIFSTSKDKDGISVYWNDEELIVEKYNRKTKHYFCGRELLTFKKDKHKLYNVLVVDVNDCCCAEVYSDYSLNILFQKHSVVPNKHKKGGQSAARFSRIRDNEITQWYKKIDDYLKSVDGEIRLGINSIYKKRFIDTLSTYNQNKITLTTSTEYADISGIYQYINKVKAL